MSTPSTSNQVLRWIAVGVSALVAAAPGLVQVFTDLHLPAYATAVSSAVALVSLPIFRQLVPIGSEPEVTKP
jgi:hypothetical protein